MKCSKCNTQHIPVLIYYVFFFRKVESECEELVENVKDKLDEFNMEERSFVRDTVGKVNGRIVKSITDPETSRMLMEQYNKRIDEMINNRIRL